MSAIDKAIKTSLQGKVFNLALIELVISYRENFKPLWTTDSWVKFLILLALKCDLSGQRESLELFAEALGPKVTAQMRRLFFERKLEQYNLRVMADPAEKEVLVMPLKLGSEINHEEIMKAIDHIGLTPQIVSEEKEWQIHESLMSIPWKRAIKTSDS